MICIQQSNSNPVSSSTNSNTTTTTTTTALKVKPMQRIDARTLTYDSFRDLYDTKIPIILTHATENPELWSEDGRSAWMDKWLDRAVNEVASSEDDSEQDDGAEDGERKVLYQIREDGVVKLYRLPLLDFIDGCMTESSHDSAWFHMDEKLIPSDMRTDYALSSRLIPPPGNMFELFPEIIRPSDRCVFLGGCGARSTLHRDPLDWTGTNFQFEGNKQWTLFKANERIDASLNAYEQKPVAWDAGAYDVGTGYESVFDLYETNPTKPASSMKKPGGSKGKRRNGKEKSHQREAHYEQEKEKSSSMEHILTNMVQPFLEADEYIYTCDQEEGDMIIIPPSFWHQTYYKTPCVSVASQYMNMKNMPIVYEHILVHCGLTDAQQLNKLVNEAAEIAQNGSVDSYRSALESIQFVFRNAMKVRHGGASDEPSDAVFASLRFPLLN